MRKNIITGLLILVIIFGGVGWMVYSMAYKQRPKAVQQNSTAAKEPAVTSGSIQLSVNDSLNTSGNLQQNVDSQASIATTPAPSSASNIVDPRSFKDYDKYKDNARALFGDLVKGTGAEAINGKKVAMYYKGWLTDGTLFDQSKKSQSGQEQPFIFEIGKHEVILGVEEAVVGMKVGGKRLVIVPPKLGYGTKQQGNIPGNSVLVFEIELLTVQ